MKYFFTSDFHLGHTKILEYCKRPFKTIEEMNEAIIKNFNTIVSPEDIVFHIGDFHFKNSDSKITSAEFEKRLNGKIIFIKGNHDCFTIDTRILTIDGFKQYNEIKTGELIPTWNMFSKKVEIKPIKKIVISNFTSSYKLKTWEFSKNHEIIITGFSKKADCFESLKKIIVKKSFERKNVFMMPTAIVSGNNDYLINIDLIKILAWIYTDGCIEKNYGYITIYQSKIKYLKEIRSLLKRLNIDYKERIREVKHKHINGKLIKSALPCHEFHFLSVGSKKIKQLLNINSKKDLPYWLWLLSDKQFETFFAELMKGDGTIANSGTRVLYKSKEFLDKIMGLCITHGRCASVIKTCRNDYYLCAYKYSSNISRTHILKKNRKIKICPIKMWCVEVENHNIFIERNGKTLLTGNSHNSTNTIIDNIVITHGGLEIFMTHNPEDYDITFKLNLIGHVHSEWKSKIVEAYGLKTVLINVGIDVNNFHPVSIEEILKEYNKVIK